MHARTAGRRPSIRGRRDAGPGGSLRDTITAYVRLTKPRIIVLLLITTIPAMILAAQGIPSIGLMLATLIGGTVAAGLGQRDQHVPRPRHRRDHATDPEPAAPLAHGDAGPRAAVRLRAGRDLVLLPVDHGERAGGHARALGDRVLRLRLHDVAEADDDAEHRDRRRGRGGAGARRMGRGDGLARGAAHGSCSRSSSCGPRRTSGRSRSGSAGTTPRRACRCSRS